MNKYKISLVASKYWLNNWVFNDTADPYNFFQILKEEFSKYNCDINTYDITPIDSADLVFYMPLSDSIHLLPKQSDVDKSFLFLYEPKMINGYWYNRKVHKYFHKIFTWDDSLVDDQKYFKIFLWLKQQFPTSLDIAKLVSKKNKLCALVASNKIIKYRAEKYSERRRAIRWFEKHHLDEFDLYGKGWDIYTSTNWFLRQINRLHPLLNNLSQKLLYKPYLSYQGPVEDKITMLEGYKFSICYENTIERGYLTEKIFECFLAGCIPIYLGCDSVTDVIPSDCFINKKNFATYEELYDYIKTMPDSDYLTYIANIERFLRSPEICKFNADNFVAKIIEQMLPEALQG